MNDKSERLTFPKELFERSLPEATKETLDDISEPMQVSDEVLRGEKKLLLTTKDPSENDSGKN